MAAAGAAEQGDGEMVHTRSTTRGGPARPRARRRALAAVGLAAALGATTLAPAAARAADPSADLSVTVTHSPSSGRSAVPFSVTITASNAGPDPAADVVAGIAFQYPLDRHQLPPSCTANERSNSVICQLGTIASGGTASATLEVLPYASGVFVIPVAVASPTPDPDTADRASTDTIIVERGPSLGQRYVAGEYPKLLGRPARTAELAFWGPRFERAYFFGEPPLASIPYDIINSNEYRRIRIRESFTRILGRTASAADLTYWVPRAASATYERLDRTLIDSREFATRNGADVPGGIYQAVLGRTPTSAERSRVQAQLAAGTPRSKVAGDLQLSNEGLNRLVADRFQLVVGRAPLAIDRLAWSSAIRRGVAPEVLVAQLFVSNEVRDQYPVTDDDYPDEGEYDFSRLAPLG